MKGIVLAGGTGSRLFPLTKITNKHLLPIYDRPMIYYPIQTLVDAGIREILIVTGGRNSGDFLRLLANGKQFGLQHINYTYQEGEGGIADALGLAEHFADGQKICVVLGDNIIEGSILDARQKFDRQQRGALEKNPATRRRRASPAGLPWTARQARSRRNATRRRPRVRGAARQRPGGTRMLSAGQADAALSRRYEYPKAAYATVKLARELKLVPEPPTAPCVANAIRTALPGITAFHERVRLVPANGWDGLLERHGLCFVAVVERHGRSSGRVAHGLLKDFGLKRGAVASSVGHDSHNIIVAGTNEADMPVALRAIEHHQGGVCVVAEGAVTAMVPLPIAGLLSDKRIGEVARDIKTLKTRWQEAGCTIAFMGFNLIPLSVIPEIRITDRGIVLVPQMTIVPLFEPFAARDTSHPDGLATADVT